MVVKNDDLYYIVAGDEMQKIINLKYPSRKTIPFREDFSKGEYRGYNIGELVNDRTSFWNVSLNEYIEKFSVIINLDFTKKYVLCFGDCECCKANLNFIIGYLKFNGYPNPIKVQIVNEYNLELIEEYIVD